MSPFSGPEGGAGIDWLVGGAGVDVLKGGTENDTLDGGIGNDILKGSSGLDTYIIRAIDGADTIEDSDSRGVVEFDGKVLLSGLRRAGESGNVFHSADGTITLTKQGTNDLVVTGSGPLTIKNFATGLFGIRLFGEADYVATTRDTFLKTVPDPNNPPPATIQVAFFDEGNNHSNNLEDPLTDGTNNLIHALGGADTIISGAGDDQLYGDGGNDELYGGLGNDRLYGGSESDQLFGDNVAVSTSGGNDFLDGGDGNDLVQGGAGRDIVFGGAGNDNLNGDEFAGDNAGGFDDYLDGGADDDELHGAAGSDVLIGGTGNDLLIGDTTQFQNGTPEQGGNDSLDGGDGQDQLFGLYGDDLLLGGMGNDLVNGQDGSDVLYGGEGNDTLSGDLRFTSLTGGYDTSEWRAAGGDDLLVGEAGADLLSGGEGNDLLDGGTEDDQLYGDYVTSRVSISDPLYWTLFSALGDDGLSGGAGNDVLAGGFGADVLEGGEGFDTLFGGEGDDRLEGGAGDDVLYGEYSFNDSEFISNPFIANIRALSGNDVLDGGDGNDTLDGGEGSDTLLGGAGNDTLGDGDSGYAVAAGNDILYGGEGNDVLESSMGDDELHGGGGNDRLISSQGNATLYGDEGDDFLSSAHESGGTGAATLIGGLGNDVYEIDGLGDIVVEAAGEGMDAVVSYNVSYTLGDNVENLSFRGSAASGVGNSLDNVMSGAKSLEGLGGNDTLTGVGRLDGGAGDDVLQGLSGVSFFNDETGQLEYLANTYVFGSGDGQDRIIENDAEFNSAYYQNEDTVSFATGIAPTDVTWEQVGNDLILNLSGGTDRISIPSFYDLRFDRGGYLVNGVTVPPQGIVSTSSGFPTYVAPSRIELVQFADGTVWDADHFGAPLLGDFRADTYRFGRGSGDVSIIDFDFSQSNATRELDSVLLGADLSPSDLTVSRVGDDLALSVNGTTDRLTIQSFFKTVTVTPPFSFSGYSVAPYRIEQVQFADGTVWTVSDLINRISTFTGTSGADTLFGNQNDNLIQGLGGDDYLSGQGGNDVLDGGAGNDRLFGDAGNDTYLFGRGGGQDTLVSYDATGTETEVVRLGSDVLPSDVTIQVVGDSNDLVLRINGTSDQLLLDEFLWRSDFQIDRLEFGDGTVWDSAMILDHAAGLTLIGTESDNTLRGSVLGDVLTGLGGNDTLIGNAGNDQLVGGLGDDVLSGDEGDDTYVFNLGDGVDTIYDEVAPGEANRILFGAGITAGDVTALQSGLTLTLTVGSGGDRIVLEDFDPSNQDGSLVVSTLQFADGSTVNLSSLLAPTPTEGDDVLTYGPDDDVIDALGGNDVVDAGAGNDIINGGAGADTLIGGIGNDTYIVDNVGDLVTENLNEGLDTVQSSFAYMLGANLENLTLLGTSAIDGNGNELANVLIGNSVANVLAGGDGNDSLDGGAGNDILNGGIGADVLSGGTGDDVLYIDADDTSVNGGGGSSDQVIVTGAAGVTLDLAVAEVELAFGAGGNDTFDGSSTTTALFLDGGTGTDVLTGGSGNDVLAGGSGNDTLTGNAGNDVLNGGAGADVLSGGDGDDLLYIDADDTSVAGGAGLDAVSVLPGSVGVTLEVAAASIEDAMGGEGNDTFIGTNATVNLLLQGNGGNDLLVGGTGIDALNGGIGNDTLDGGLGADILVGGVGDDTYVIDDAGDQVTELTNEGTDTVQSGISYVLGANLEQLILTGTANLTGTGNSLNNLLTGNSGDNLLDGGVGADTMIGGQGNDTYVVDHINDIVTEALNEGTDTVQSAITYTLGANVENLTLTGTGAITGTGNALNNVLTGNSGDNVLDGGAGADTLIGGAGNDTYVVGNVADVITEQLNEGIDTVQSAVTYTLGGHLENLTLTGVTTLNGTGNTLSNVVTGNSAANVLDGGVGADTLIGGAGNDTYLVDNVGDVVTEQATEGLDTVQSAVTFTLGANVENLTLTGAAALNGTGNSLDNVLTGNSGSNTLTGGAGNDTLDGGTGTDTLLGGTGNDLYVVDAVGDLITELANEGTDTVQSAVTFTLGANLENLTLTGMTTINGTGNTLNNVLTGNSAANVLDGGTGVDTLIGGAGDDTYVVDNVGDVVTEQANEGIDTVQSAVTYTLAANVENLTLTGTTAINGTGNSLDNVLTGNSAANTLTGGAGNDTLNGAAGNDTLIGGTGNDLYVVDVTGDVVTELANEGTDTVQSAVTYTLAANVLTGGAGNDTYVIGAGDTVVEAASSGTDTVQSSVTHTLAANVENLTLTGTTAINGTGNTLANVLTGNSAANVLDGGTSTDTLIGGAGDDTYIVDNVGDVVTEQASEGLDTVQSGVTYTLAANVENLALTGTTAINGTGNTLDNVLTGNSGSNTLTGGAGNDTLNGGAGNDTLIGGTGDDLYVVDATGDVVTEQANEGTDSVQSAVTFTLAANVENLTLTGTTAINGTGNTLDNVLTGNSAANTLTGGAGNDTLDGGIGNDTMLGGTGNDTYVVNATGDVVTENANEGTDTVQSAVTFTLGANLENLTLTGTTAINGTGNTLDNVLTGNSGTNTLTGGAGNDTYVIGVGDTVVETAGNGTDAVQSAVTHTLAANVENLTLTGATAINGTGNTLDNLLTGNSAVNTLTGAAGLDTLSGGLGNDVLNGGTGNDTYLFARGDGQDIVQDADATGGNTDHLLYGSTINPLDLVLSRQVNDLRISIHGTTDQVTIQNWYTSPTTNQVEDVQAGNGQHLVNTQVDQLIQAMATFTQQTGLTWDQAIDQQPQAVQTILAASWQ